MSNVFTLAVSLVLTLELCLQAALNKFHYCLSVSISVLLFHLSLKLTCLTNCSHPRSLVPHQLDCFHKLYDYFGFLVLRSFLY